MTLEGLGAAAVQCVTIGAKIRFCSTSFAGSDMMQVTQKYKVKLDNIQISAHIKRNVVYIFLMIYVKGCK